MDQSLENLLDQYTAQMSQLPNYGLGLVSKLETALTMTITLSDAIRNMDQDPVPVLKEVIQDQITYLSGVEKRALPHLDQGRECLGNYKSEENRTQVLFEQAWTTYSDETYDHSVTLVEARLRASGLDEAFFAGKRCFDGGCGTGRLSLAMAKMGAKEVVAADFGQESLDYFAKVIERYGLDNITPMHQDVTDLSNIEDASFDFVASYGVLHHTANCERGMKHHYRITKPGGHFWIYLYGANGIYWEIYDRIREQLKSVDLQDIKHCLSFLGVREGLIYTCLDNLFAPRTYHLESETVAMLSEIHPLTYVRAKGVSTVDDTEKVLASAYGATLFGPEGEVRIVVEKGK